MSEWRTIYSAPFGRGLLLCGAGKRVWCGGFFEQQGYQGLHVFLDGDTMQLASARDMTDMPTHWMPLPEPPQ